MFPSHHLPLGPAPRPFGGREGEHQLPGARDTQAGGTCGNMAASAGLLGDGGDGAAEETESQNPSMAGVGRTSVGHLVQTSCPSRVTYSRL